MVHTILIIASIAIEITAIVFAVLHLKRQNQHRTRGEIFEDRVKHLTEALQEAIKLIGKIESEINARSALATQLQEDLDRYNKLIEIKKPEVEAITQLLRGEVQKEGRSSFWKSLLINFVFFLLGGALSLSIALLIH
jgi:vacuolar-type H+-ATPase subunit I/STV1